MKSDQRSGLADPALKGIYNGKTLGENYRDLNPKDLGHDASIGVLLSGLGGTVDMAQTGYGTTGKMGSSTPYDDIMNAATPTEQQAANHPEHLRYQELISKFLDGSIAEYEFEELRKLDDAWSQLGLANKRIGGIPETLVQLDTQGGETKEGQEFLKNKENIATLMSKVKREEISIKVRSQVQGKHIEGTKQFDEYLNLRKTRGQTPQSILTVSEQEAQELVDRYWGTGVVVIQKGGDNSLKIYEFCNADRIVGKWYGSNGFHETKRFQIIYSKKGIHIVPVKEDYHG